MSLLKAISGYLGGSKPASAEALPSAVPHRFARTPQTDLLADFLLRRLSQKP